MPKKINSRAKGARVERAWRDECRAEGWKAFRGAQYSGKNPTTGEAAPDVVTPELSVHWEVKGVEKLNIYSAVEQAQRDRNEGEMGIVAHKKNGKPWLMTMLAEDGFQLLRESELVKAKTKTNSKTIRYETHDDDAEGHEPETTTIRQPGESEASV